MINWNRRKYTKQEFIEAWNSSLSIAQVAKKLNCNKTGGGYITLNLTATELDLTKEHMTGCAWNKGDEFKNPGIVTPLEEILVENPTYKGGSYALKNKLWKAGLLEKKCSRCGIAEWQGEAAPLALDHINGNNRDNRLINLRILCYNCHGLTPTYGRKKRLALEV